MGLPSRVPSRAEAVTPGRCARPRRPEQPSRTPESSADSRLPPLAAVCAAGRRLRRSRTSPGAAARPGARAWLWTEGPMIPIRDRLPPAARALRQRPDHRARTCWCSSMGAGQIALGRPPPPARRGASCRRCSSPPRSRYGVERPHEHVHARPTSSCTSAGTCSFSGSSVTTSRTRSAYGRYLALLPALGPWPRPPRRC